MSNKLNKKMKNLLTFLGMLAFLGLSQVVNAQQKFNVQNGAKTEFYNDIETAIEQAQAGDTVYLPAGLIQLQNDLVIDKRLSLVGVGWDINTLQTTFPTEINKIITFTENANGSLLTGCKINGNIYLGNSSAVQDIKLIRNQIIGAVCYIYIYAGSSNISIRENYIYLRTGNQQFNISANPASTSNLPHNCFIENNIFSCGGTALILSIKNSYVINNVFDASFGLNDNSYNIKTNYTIVQNNYIRNTITYFPSLYAGENNIFNNNAFGNDVTFPGGSNTGVDNLMNQAFDDTFESGTYHVKATSLCKNAGTDGTDIGIYGGVFPYKDGSIPFNPHIRPNSIATQTDSEGKLQINITITAQER